MKMREYHIKEAGSEKNILCTIAAWDEHDALIRSGLKDLGWQVVSVDNSPRRPSRIEVVREGNA